MKKGKWLGKEAEKGAEISPGRHTDLSGSLDPTFLPFQGALRECLPGSHPPSLVLPISVENHVLLHAYMGPPCPHTHRACV